MTFPSTPLPILVEADLDGTWTDITSDVRRADAIQIRRGRSSEGSRVDPGSLTNTLDNRTGDYSPRNPNGTHYGLIGRNTPIRVSVTNGQPRCVQGATLSDYFYAADSAALSITGDIDLRADITLPSWRPTSSVYLGISKAASYWWYLSPDGHIVIAWTPDGSTTHTITSAEPVPGSPVGRKCVRATLDVNYLGTHARASFYTSDSIGGTWTAFGGDVTESGTTSIYNSTAIVTTAVSSHDWAEVDAIQIRDGIGGTIVAYPIFTSQAEGATSFSDSYSNTWTATGAAEVTAKHYRIHGEAAEWITQSDTSGNDVTTRLDCAGPLRRLSQGDAPTPSALRRGAEDIGAGLVAYWPLEDGEDADRFAVVQGTQPARIIDGVTPASSSAFAASAPIPVLGETGRIYCPVNPYTNTGEAQIRWIGTIPSTTANGAIIARIFTNSSLGWADLSYGTGGDLRLRHYNNAGASTNDSGLIAFAVDDKLLRFSVELTQDGSDVDWALAIYEQDATAAYASSGTDTAVTLGSIRAVYFNPDGVDLSGVSVGHVTVENAFTSLYGLAGEMNAHASEDAVTRLQRLTTEHGTVIEVDGAGDATYSEPLGRQTRGSFLALLQEIEDADGGVLFEDRHALGLRYRTLDSLCVQDAVVTLDYSDGGLAEFVTTDDDQRTRNKVTVTRAGGSSATVEDTWSALSTSSPPDGVGLYEDTATLSLYRDAQTVQQAGWRVHLGTVDEARLVRVAVNLAHPDYVADQALTRALLQVDIGDRIVVTNPPAWLPPEDLDCIVQGITERIDQFEHTLSFTTAPASPFRVGVWDSADAIDSRWSSDTTTVNGAHGSGATTVSVDIADGVLWDDTDGDFDVMNIDKGERVTVTAVAGASSPQDLTVTRAVNGVSVAWEDGDRIRLFTPAHWSL